MCEKTGITTESRCGRIKVSLVGTPARVSVACFGLKTLLEIGVFLFAIKSRVLKEGNAQNGQINLTVSDKSI